MISSDKYFGNHAANKRMSDLVKTLSIEEQRILARLLNNWEERDQRLYPRIPCAIVTEYHALNRLYKDTIKNISKIVWVAPNGFGVQFEIVEERK